MNNWTLQSSLQFIKSIVVANLARSEMIGEDAHFQNIPNINRRGAACAIGGVEDLEDVIGK